jgi:hypothetical protein
MLNILVIIARGPPVVATSGTPSPHVKACAPNNAHIGAIIDTMLLVSIGCPLAMVTTVGASPPLYVNATIKLPMLELLALILFSPLTIMSQSPLVFRTQLMRNLHRT